MFVKAMDIIREESRRHSPEASIRKRLSEEAELSGYEIDILIDETLPGEAMKYARQLMDEILKSSQIPEPLMKRLLAGERSKTIAALRTELRRQLYASTRLKHKEINELVGLSCNSRHITSKGSSLP